MKKEIKILHSASGALLILLFLIIWQVISVSALVPKFMLPSPVDVLKAFVLDFNNLMQNTFYTLQEALIGLLIGIAVGFIFAVLMERFKLIYKALYPILVITQTIPSIAIAPLLILWLGYDLAPKIALVAIVCFFPITVSLLDGFKEVDIDNLNLIRSMGANRFQTFFYLKLPYAKVQFFSGLKICVSYAVVSAVIAEWLGGFMGLGVYMTQAKKAFEFDKMFAVIILISFISLLLIFFVSITEKAFKKGVNN
jgi:ABC-type nitrate/sulfonate/bicarbonate transport system permease component